MGPRLRGDDKTSAFAMARIHRDGRMSDYEIEVRPAAARALAKLETTARLRVQGAIALLCRDPRPPASRKLSGRDAYRVRVGDCRIIYTIHDGILVVVVVAVGHRRDIYSRWATGE